MTEEITKRLLALAQRFFDDWYKNFGEEDFFCSVLEGEDFPLAEEINFGTGATKLVLWEDRDYVVKIPFFYDYDGEDALEEDYCAIEERNSKRAEKAGLDCFAPVRYIGTIEGHRCYAQPYIGLRKDISKELVSSITSAHCQYLERMNESRTTLRITDELMAQLIVSYGEDGAEKIIEFCEENEINDLHNGNWGMVDGKPVFFDYSGYHGASWCAK